MGLGWVWLGAPRKVSAQDFLDFSGALILSRLWPKPISNLVKRPFQGGGKKTCLVVWATGGIWATGESKGSEGSKGSEANRSVVNQYCKPSKRNMAICLTYGMPVKDIMSSWTEQMGFLEQLPWKPSQIGFLSIGGVTRS